MSNCDHDQLYAHVTLKVALPVKHNSAAEISRVYNWVSFQLEEIAGCKFVVSAPIEVHETSDL